MDESIEDSEDLVDAPVDFADAGDSEVEPALDLAPEGDEAYPEFFSKEEFLSDVLAELASLSSDDFSELSDEELKDKQCEGYARIRAIIDTHSGEESAEPEGDEGEESGDSGEEDSFEQDFSDDLDDAGL